MQLLFASGINSAGETAIHWNTVEFDSVAVSS